MSHSKATLASIYSNLWLAADAIGSACSHLAVYHDEDKEEILHPACRNVDVPSSTYATIELMRKVLTPAVELGFGSPIVDAIDLHPNQLEAAVMCLQLACNELVDVMVKLEKKINPTDPLVTLEWTLFAAHSILEMESEFLASLARAANGFDANKGLAKLLWSQNRPFDVPSLIPDFAELATA